MILTRFPVEAESSVTELSPSFDTQIPVPATVMPEGSSNPFLEPPMTRTRAPLRAENSVTELSDEFATQI